MQFIETIKVLSADQWRFITLLALCITISAIMIGFIIGHLCGRIYNRSHIDRDTIIEASAIFVDRIDGKIDFSVSTPQTMPALHRVFNNRKLEKMAYCAAKKTTPGEPLLSPLDTHFTAMERVCAFVSGADYFATQSALSGRRDEFTEDAIAVFLTSVPEDKGASRPCILKMDLGRLLEASQDPEVFALRLVPTHRSYERYSHMVRRMAAHFRDSELLFKQMPDKKLAGALAPVWKTVVRTRRTLTTDDVKQITAETIAYMIPANENKGKCA